MIEIIGDRGKRRRYDPNLAEKVNAEARREKEKGGNQEELQNICKGFESSLAHKTGKTELRCREIAEQFKFSRKTIECFTKEKALDYRALEDDKDQFEFVLSVYLSSLISKSKDKTFILDLNNFNKAGILLDSFGNGVDNKKFITLVGDVGDYLGCSSSPIISVYGNAGDYVGFHAGKTQITIRGDAGKNVGFCAVNSKIYIKGNVGGLSDYIGVGTEIFQDIGGMRKIYPK